MFVRCNRLVVTVFSIASFCLSSFCFSSALHADETKPYGGKPHPIPGKIEAEHWDLGKPDIAYHDVDEKNRGENYREKTQVDIEKRSDASNGHGVGWTRKGEWLVYTVMVKESGKYDIEFPVACDKQGGEFHLELDGKDVTGPIEIPDTGGWTTLKKITKRGVTLQKGLRKIKMVMDSEGEVGSTGDIDYMRFSAAK